MSIFLKQKKKPTRNVDPNGPVGTEAEADEATKINAKAFKYPDGGFVNRIEHTLLYTMIRESSIFPAETVMKAIEEEDFSVYFYVRPQKGNADYRVSYAQLTAILALAGEEWEHNSEVPPTLCRHITKRVLRYANEHDLDRKTELDELLKPLYEYAVMREAKQSAKIMPWLIPAMGLTIVTGNPLPAYAAFVGAHMAHSATMEKGAHAAANTDKMLTSGDRSANAEQASLLDEAYIFDEDEANDLL